MSPGAKAGIMTALSSMGLELCWLLAWANYLSLGIFHRPFPWPAALAGFLGAGLVHGLTRGRGLRFYLVALAHLFGLALACLWLAHFYHGGGAGLYDSAWLRGLFLAPHPASFWLGFSSQSLLCAWFWWQGAAWQSRSRDHEKLLLRFDLGLSAFVLLFLIKFLLRIRFQEMVADPAALPLTAAFFCFSSLALVQSRTRQDPASPGRTGVTRSLAGMGAGSLLLAAGVAAFCLPWLREAADGGYRVLKAVATPLYPYLVRALRFVLVPSSRISRSPGRPGDGSSHSMPADQLGSAPSWLEWIAQALLWLLLAIVAVLVLVLLGFLLRRFWLLMISRTGETKKPPPFWQDLRQFLAMLWARFSGWLPGLRIKGHGPAAGLARLRRWGQRGGVSGLKGETPREYGRRLGLAYPKLGRAIGHVVQAHEAAVYGGRPWGGAEESGMKRSLRRLKNPLLWPRRVFTRLKAAWRRERAGDDHHLRQGA